ncbi:hypothetical protein GCM10008949_47160 [Deinococcus humi]|nr:hypothetical protein GCM10008949_47160 [Deinococcus humi]
MNFTGSDKLHMMDGRIVEYWANADSLLFMQQIGAIPGSSPELSGLYARRLSHSLGVGRKKRAAQRSRPSGLEKCPCPVQAVRQPLNGCFRVVEVTTRDRAPPIAFT